MGKFNFNDGSDFEKVKAEAEAFYKTIGAVRCPYFDNTVAFNAKGLRHLKFKSDRQARPQTDQYARMKLMHLAPQVLKKSHTVQGIWETTHFETVNTNNRWERVLKHVTYWEFLAVLGSVRIKVVVKEVAGGEKHFWSIIPFWGINKEAGRRILYSGDPVHD